jgi:hypothetical protein
MLIFRWKCVFKQHTSVSVLLQLMLQQNCEDINIGQIHFYVVIICNKSLIALFILTLKNLRLFAVGNAKVNI